MRPHDLVYSIALACAACAGAEKQPVAPRSEPTAQTAPASARIERRVVISLGRPSGTSVLTVDTDGTLHTVLHVVENGRGPHVESTITLAPDGTLARFEASGNHEMGTQFSSSFRREGARAIWRSSEESGEQQQEGPAFFVPLAEVAELEGLMVRAALQHGGRLSLLPKGELRVEKLADVQLQTPAGSRSVSGYYLSGLDLTSIRTWMNADGSWFGSVSEWFSVVPEGWEAAIEPLIAKQRELDRARATQVYRELAHAPPAAGLAFTHARVLDVERGRWLPDHTLLIVGDKIAELGPSARVRLPAGAQVIDAAAKALIPGLWDLHTHLGDADGPLDIASGVTTVRDVGNDPDKLDDYKQRFDAGGAIGPHVLRFGFIEGRNEKAASSKITAETVDEAQAAVKFYADRNYEGVKIYNSVRPELVPVIAAAAHARGLRVTGHIPVHMLAHEAVEAGYDGIEHINMLFLNFFATHDTDTRTTMRFTLVGDQAPELDLHGESVRAFFELLKRKKVLIDPTLAAFEDLYVGVPGAISPGLEPMVARLPATTGRVFLLGGLPGDHQPRYRQAFDKLLAMVKALYDAQVSLAIGTDALPGLMLHHELELFSRAGIPNAAILRLATLDAARNMGQAAEVGSLAKGKRADLALIDGDPLARIDEIGRVVSTVRAGVMFDAAAVYRTVSVQPAAKPAALRR